MAGESKKGGKSHVPGNVLESARRFNDYLTRHGKAWLECREDLARLADQDITVTGIKLKGYWGEGEEILVILSARGPEGPLVAFHNVSTIEDMWVGLRNRIRADSLKWRVDEPFRGKT